MGGRLARQGDMTEPETHLPPEDEADLVALADGNLDPARALEVEARVAADSVLADALAEQRAALALLATADTVAMPPALRLRVAEIEARGAGVCGAGCGSGSRRSARRWPPQPPRPSSCSPAAAPASTT